MCEKILLLLDEPSTDDDDDGFDFHVSFRLDVEGNMDFSFGWPQDINPAVSAQVIANLLYNLQIGNVNPQIIQGLKGYGIKEDKSDMTELISYKFCEMIDFGSGNDIAVKPDEIFRRQE